MAQFNPKDSLEVTVSKGAQNTLRLTVSKTKCFSFENTIREIDGFVTCRLGLLLFCSAEVNAGAASANEKKPSRRRCHLNAI